MSKKNTTAYAPYVTTPTDKQGIQSEGGVSVARQDYTDPTVHRRRCRARSASCRAFLVIGTVREAGSRVGEVNLHCRQRRRHAQPIDPRPAVPTASVHEHSVHRLCASSTPAPVVSPPTRARRQGSAAAAASCISCRSGSCTRVETSRVVCRRGTC